MIEELLYGEEVSVSEVFHASPFSNNNNKTKSAEINLKNITNYPTRCYVSPMAKPFP